MAQSSFSKSFLYVIPFSIYLPVFNYFFLQNFFWSIWGQTNGFVTTQVSLLEMYLLFSSQPVSHLNCFLPCPAFHVSFLVGIYGTGLIWYLSLAWVHCSFSFVSSLVISVTMMSFSFFILSHIWSILKKIYRK